MNKRAFLKYIIIAGFVIGLIMALGVFIFIYKSTQDLPDYQSLKSYEPIVTTRLYAADGKLISEYSKEKRIFVPIEMMSNDLKNAFIAAEDSTFYKNSGIDIFAIFRAALKNVMGLIFGSSERMGGASTITQQVVKNFLLTNERTITRKVKEAALAIQITKEFPKDKILELYLNQIYLGSGSYGVAAAAEVYFDKSLDELSVEEFALLATLPKAPSKLDPRKNIAKAKIRRDWVIDRMYSENFITQNEAEEAKTKPIILKLTKDDKDFTKADFFADAVKSKLTNMYGSDNVFESGIYVKTTLNSKFQQYANMAIKKGIEDYDKRHGYRGPLDNIKINAKEDISEAVKEISEFKIEKLYDENWKRALVTKVEDKKINIITEEEKIGVINIESTKWAKKYIEVDKKGPVIKNMSQIFKEGDIILVSSHIEEGDKDELVTSDTQIEDEYILQQIPSVNGALLAMDPHTGRVLAMMGGYIDSPNQFNRAIQAMRQPGSTMKTFGYLAALENGMTPSSIIIDEPITLDQGDDLPPYNPTNYSGEFYGPTTLRVGLEKSRNVTTVRMADEIGLDKVAEVVKRLGINDDPQVIHSLVLGSTETSLLKLVKAYSVMINGGNEVDYSLIEKIQDRNGKTVYKRDQRNCPSCSYKTALGPDDLKLFPELKNEKNRLIEKSTSYQIAYMLQGVVERGTAAKARSVKKIMGGKTGTTNNSYDSWYVGFTPDLIVGVYIGFDNPSNLGKYETGASVALPIFNDFMIKALENTPSTPFRVPSDIKFVKIDRKTGRYPTSSTSRWDLHFEAFKDSDNTHNILSNKEPVSSKKYQGRDEDSLMQIY